MEFVEILYTFTPSSLFTRLNFRTYGHHDCRNTRRIPRPSDSKQNHYHAPPSLSWYNYGNEEKCIKNKQAFLHKVPQ